MFGDVHLSAVRDHLNLLTAITDGCSRCSKFSLLVFERFLPDPILRILFGHFPAQRFLLFSKRPLDGSLFGRVGGALRGIVMEAFLNLFGQLRKIDFRDSRAANQHKTVGFDSANRDVFVLFPVNCFEVVSKGD